jgi:hypothetical protein
MRSDKIRDGDGEASPSLFYIVEANYEPCIDENYLVSTRYWLVALVRSE